MDRTGVGIGVVIGIVLSSIEAAYMLFLRVPSVLAVRPELKDVGFVTGVFSGRGGVYLWHHYPIPAFAVSVVLLSLFGVVAVGMRT